MSALVPQFVYPLKTVSYKGIAISPQLLSVGLTTLATSSYFKFLGIGLEEVSRFLRMGTSNIVKGSCRNVVRFVFPNQRVILK